MRKNNKNIHQIYGINNSAAVLRNRNYQIHSIEILEKSAIIKNEVLSEILAKNNAHIKIIKNDIFHRKYEGKRTQGIVVSFSGDIAKPLPSLNAIEGDYCLLIIDNLSDPQNLGQIIRTAECAGIDGLIIPERNSVGFTDVVLQVSQGAFCHIPLYTVTNLNQTLSQLKKDDFWIVAFENGIDTRPWDKIDYKGKVALVVGSEGYGIKPIVLNACDFQATIPMQSSTSSLNVSAAVAAIVFERLRQLLK